MSSADEASASSSSVSSSEDEESKQDDKSEKKKPSPTVRSGKATTTLITATDQDVLFGRGKPFIRHKGNIALHNVADGYRLLYKEFDCKLVGLVQRKKKFGVSTKREIVDAIISKMQDRGARFLKKNKAGVWVHVSHAEARSKVSHLLRSPLRRESIVIPVEEMIIDGSVPYEKPRAVVAVDVVAPKVTKKRASSTAKKTKATTSRHKKAEKGNSKVSSSVPLARKQSLLAPSSNDSSLSRAVQRQQDSLEWQADYSHDYLHDRTASAVDRPRYPASATDRATYPMAASFLASRDFYPGAARAPFYPGIAAAATTIYPPPPHARGIPTWPRTAAPYPTSNTNDPRIRALQEQHKHQQHQHYDARKQPPR